MKYHVFRAAMILTVLLNPQLFSLASAPTHFEIHTRQNLTGVHLPLNLAAGEEIMLWSGERPPQFSVSPLTWHPESGVQPFGLR